MLTLLASCVLAQTWSPPLSAPAHSVGRLEPLQDYPPASAAAIAMDGAAVELLWLDARRSLGESPGAPTMDLWWGRKLPSSLPTVALIAKGATVLSLRSPTIAISGQNRLIGWIDSQGMPRVELRESPLGGAPVTSTSVTAPTSSVLNVAVTAWDGGFAIAKTDLTHYEIDTWPPPNSPSLGTMTAAPNRFVFSQAGDHLLVGYEEPTKMIGDVVAFPGATPISFFNLSGTRLAGLSPGRNEFVAFDSTVNPVPLTAYQVGFGGVLIGNYRATEVLATGTGTTTLFVTSNLGAGVIGRWAGGAPITTPTMNTGLPLAIAAGPTRAAVLHGGSGVAITDFDPQTLAAQLTSVRFAPTMRGPSIAWLARANAFVIAWEERASAIDQWGTRLGFLDQLGPQATVVSNEAVAIVSPQPHLTQTTLDQVAGTRRSGGSTEIFGVEPDGGLVVTGTVGLSDWQFSNAPAPVLFRRATDGSLQLQGAAVLLTAPRCAAGLDGKSFFAGWTSATATEVGYVFVSDAGVSSITPIAGSGAAAQPICTTRSALGDELVLSWADGQQVRVARLTIDRPSATIRGVRYFTVPSSPTPANPEAVVVPSGILVAFEHTPDFDGLSTVLIQPDGGQLALQNTTSTLGVRAPHFAVTPTGTAAMVWQEFDRVLGATRLRSRLLIWDGGTGTNDGGALPDAGRPDSGAPDAGATDAGSADAGASDAGTPDTDAGATDAGMVEPDGGAIDAGLEDGGAVVDAGAVDAGVDAGTPGPDDAGAPDGGADGGRDLAFVPTCSCNGAGQGVSVIVLLAVVGWSQRGRRRRAG